MAAVDPTEEPEADDDGKVPAIARSTLRIVKQAIPGLEDEDDEMDDDLAALLGGDDESDEDEPNGGPSDPAKAKKQKQAAALRKLIEAAQEEEDDDEEMEDAKPNGIKGKGKAARGDASDDDESDDDSEDGADLENFVLCTLDTERVGFPWPNFASHLLTHFSTELPADHRHYRG